MKFSKISKIIVATIVIALLVTFITRYHQAQVLRERAQADASVGIVRRDDLTQRVTISGQVWPNKRLDVRPSFSGYIVKLFVKIGDHLKTHDPIVTFSPSLAGGETNFPVRVGFDGEVTQVVKAEGEYVTETGSDNNLVARIEDLSTLYILATVPELDVAKIKIGQEALVRVSALASENFKAVIEQIALSARDKDKYSSSSTEFTIKARLLSHDHRLYPGMSSLMDVITAKREKTLLLGHEYIQEKDGNSFVTLESGAKRDIKIGLQTDDAVEILSGLSENDRVRPIDFLTLPKLEE